MPPEVPADKSHAESPNENVGEALPTQPVQQVHPMVANPWGWYPARMFRSMYPGFNPMMMGLRMPMMVWPQVVPQEQNAPVESTVRTPRFVPPRYTGPKEPGTVEPNTGNTCGHVQHSDGGPLEPGPLEPNTGNTHGHVQHSDGGPLGPGRLEPNARNTCGNVQHGDGGPEVPKTEKSLPPASTEIPVPPTPLLGTDHLPPGETIVSGEEPVGVPTMPDAVREGGQTRPAAVPVVESAVPGPPPELECPNPPPDQPPGPPEDDFDFEYVEKEVNWNESTDAWSTRGWVWNRWQGSWRGGEWNGREEAEAWYDMATDEGEGVQTCADWTTPDCLQPTW